MKMTQLLGNQNRAGVAIFYFLVILLLLQPILAQSNCTCQETQYGDQNEHKALKFKLLAIASILVASALGISFPILLKSVPTFQPDTPFHFLVKAFAAGVILATGFVHILPDAFASLTSPCIGENPWGGFPLTGIVAMAAAIGTLMMESFATGYHNRTELGKALPLVDDHHHHPDHEISIVAEHSGHVTDHIVPAILLERSNSSDQIRNRIVSQVLEVGIVVHSVIIGVSLGATRSSKTIKPLIAALSFHQFFEGMGLGGCIIKANYKVRAIIIMVLFFALTAPTGIAIGIILSKVYNANSPTALVVEGILNSASGGILIYMALVDLLATDFMNPKMLSNSKVQFGANVSLLLGACSMSLLAKVL